MKKIGIITLNGNMNYGNRLQNYALQEVLSELGYEVDTVIIERPTNSVMKKLMNAFKTPLKTIDRFFNYKTKKDIKMMKLMISSKEQVVKPFTKSYIKTVHVSKEDVGKIDAIYDCFVVGSDQVWHPDTVHKDRTNFLYFAHKTKRVSYAASFGVANLSKKEKMYYKKNLAQMHSISVREDAGVEIIQDLLGLTCEKFLDPTMLLSRENWKEKISELKREPNDYILIYMLRELSDTKKRKIVKWAEERNLKIIQIMGDFYNEKHIICDPLEYVHLISNAKMVFTDSFHGCVFSIIMHTPFLALKRNGGNMYSRIEALLKQFDMTYNEDSDESDFNQIIERTDFSKVDQIICSEREKALNYLKQALNIQENE